MAGILKRLLALLGGLGLGALGGFAASLLRRRPTTHYADSLRQPVASDDAKVETGRVETSRVEVD